MQKLIGWCKSNWLFLASCLLLAFIPLYPKLPLVDIRNTWVYIRAEDFVIFLLLIVWGISFIRNNGSLKTPITIPILLFWLVGAVSTLHSIFFIFPTSTDIFPNVSFLSFLRRMEYMSLFFIVFTGVKNKRILPYVIFSLWATLLAVSVYGIGQKYLGFPAFLTMNEEFAKGIPIQLSALSRVSSTFGGHYDLAAYLVLIIPIFASLFFAYKNIVVKVVIAITSCLSVVVLFMTVSRISFFAVLVSLGIVLFFQRRAWVLTLFPLAIVSIVVLFIASPSLLNRFGSTVKSVDVLVDAKTGNDIGHIVEMKSDYFRDKIVRQQFYLTISDAATKASPSGAFIIPYESLPPTVTLLTDPTAPTGENLPSGTGYINLPLSPDVKKIRDFLYEPKGQSETSSANVFVINGEYLIKRVAAYDLSFTTRFQGEWPKAIAAFERNVLFGSGYGTVSLAVDNSYLRMLAEVGALGFLAFLSIFLMMGLFIVRVWPKIDSTITKSFVLGFAGGVIGLFINAAFIDVFEASKVAFVLWILTGCVIGILCQYDRAPSHIYRELTKAATTSIAICMYLFIGAWLLFSPMTRNFFVGDDFTWFRWAASTPAHNVIKYFTESMGFFYRPGTKLYFFGMYQLFWLNQTVYHAVSLILHFMMSVLVYFLALKLFRKKLQSTVSAFLFLGLSGFSETIFWISATGFLFSSNFILLSTLCYIAWRERGSKLYSVGTFLFFALALLFHELGVVTPFIFLLYEYTLSEKKRITIWIFLPLVIYGLARFLSQSHWFSGDYNYNLFKFPLNAIGNVLGYGMLSVIGPSAMPIYEALRGFLRAHIVYSFIGALIGVSIGCMIIRYYWRSVELQHQKILKFAVGFFFIALLPFLGLGNITSRYSYLSSVGVVFVLVYALEKLYQLLFRSGRDIARLALGVVIGVFMLWNVVMLQTEHHDWYQAGEKVRQLVVAMDDAYENEWGTKSMELNFVDVPIRFGQAWVFPVGLPDALWFVFRNSNIRVTIQPSISKALDAVSYNSEIQKIFLFHSDGLVTEVKKPAPVSP